MLILIPNWYPCCSCNLILKDTNMYSNQSASAFNFFFFFSFRYLKMDFKGLEKFPCLISYCSKNREDIHKWIKNKINYDDESKGCPHSFYRDASFFDCRLCASKHLDQGFQKLYCISIFDECLTNSLEKHQTLNWCPNLVKLEAVAVPSKFAILLLKEVIFTFYLYFTVS